MLLKKKAWSMFSAHIDIKPSFLDPEKLIMHSIRVS